jgi:hypothetical protein
MDRSKASSKREVAKLNREKVLSFLVPKNQEEPTRDKKEIRTHIYLSPSRFSVLLSQANIPFVPFISPRIYFSFCDFLLILRKISQNTVPRTQFRRESIRNYHTYERIFPWVQHIPV